MKEGKVKWFNAQKGYGFIIGDDGNDIFVHYTGIASDGYKTLEEGQAVQYEESNGSRGLQATNVIVIG